MASQRELVKELFGAALDRKPEQRAAFLDRACNDNVELRQELEALLAAHADAGSFLEHPTLEACTADSPGTATNTIGPYRLLELIGEGGMGQVWLAEQKQPVRRRVAIKLVKAGMDTREVVARFESERQALALMDHPAIAKVFEAGSTPEGRPYFVMEYVPGLPITDYCDKHKFTILQRMELFIQVCEGVQHAHQKAIIHRDLKPSNILVTEVDGKPMPRIIDFGVAKATSQKLTAQTVYTRIGMLIGTLGYMSPEQADPIGEDIDTRADIYSLGGVLYELLAGAPPFDFQKLAYDQVLRILRDQDAPRPSTKLTTLGEDSTTAAKNRASDPPTLVRQLRGDPDAIALKALEKDRNRRYASASGLAADIGRYLRNEPVIAHPPSAAYRARKFARRYRGSLITACAFVLVLVAAAAVSIRQSIRANREAAVAEAVNNFLQNDLLAQASTLKQSGPATGPDPDLKVRTALDRAAARIGSKFAGQPEVEASIRDTIGVTYMDLGLYPEARTQLERAFDLQTRTLGAKNPRTIKTMSLLGAIAVRQGRFPEAEALLTQALGIQRTVLGTAHPDTLDSANRLGVLYNEEGKYPQAEVLNRQTLEVRRRVQGPEHPDTLRAMANLALAYQEEGKYPQAEELDSRTLEIQRRILGPDHPSTLMTAGNLAIVYDQQGKYGKAEALDSQILDIRRRVLGPEHPDTLMTAGNLAIVYQEEKKYVEAEALNNETLEIRRRVQGPEHPDTLMTASNLANLYELEGKYAQADSLDSRILEIQRRTLGSEHHDTLVTADDLALAYNQEGKYVQADELQSQVLEISRRVLGPEHPDTLTIVADAAFMYQQQRNSALAETYAAQALAGRRHVLGSEHPDTIASVMDLALAYISEGKFTEAEPLAREAVNFGKAKQSDDWQRFRAESLLGASLAGEKKYSEAEPLLVEGYKGMLARKDRIDVPERYHLNLAHEWLVQLYRAWDKPEKAAEWSKK
jgi:serine/threonine protein kinase